MGHYGKFFNNASNKYTVRLTKFYLFTKIDKYTILKCEYVVCTYNESTGLQTKNLCLIVAPGFLTVLYMYRSIGNRPVVSLRRCKVLSRINVQQKLIISKISEGRRLSAGQSTERYLHANMSHTAHAFSG